MRQKNKGEERCGENHDFHSCSCRNGTAGPSSSHPPPAWQALSNTCNIFLSPCHGLLHLHLAGVDARPRNHLEPSNLEITHRFRVSVRPPGLCLERPDRTPAGGMSGPRRKLAAPKWQTPAERRGRNKEVGNQRKTKASRPNRHRRAHRNRRSSGLNFTWNLRTPRQRCCPQPQRAP